MQALDHMFQQFALGESGLGIKFSKQRSVTTIANLCRNLLYLWANSDRYSRILLISFKPDRLVAMFVYNCSFSAV